MSTRTRRNIVVPVDFSDESLAAVDVALDWAEEGAKIHVIHVLPELSAVEPGVIWDTVSDESRTQNARQALEERLTGSQYSGVDCAVVIGDPGREIAEFASRLEADLIVTPSHGRSGLERMLIGSVAERVIRLAHCPVLVLRR